MRYNTRVITAADGTPLSLDVFAPVGRSNRVAIILIHGGGWRAGSPSSVHRYAAHLASVGFTAIAVQYRFTTAAPWPAQLDDVIAAIAWVRSNAAALEIDAEHIVLEGFSAGAHLAMMAGGQDAGLAAIVAFFGPSCLAFSPSNPAELDAAMLLGADGDPAMADAASPIKHVTAAFPPTMLLHGAADWAVSPASSREMYDQLDRHGVPTELHIFAGEEHEFACIPSMVGPVQEMVVNFLRNIVPKPSVRTPLRWGLRRCGR
jgi:acetyl esterase/lipase